jgi:hypothetical protein
LIPFRKACPSIASNQYCGTHGKARQLRLATLKGILIAELSAIQRRKRNQIIKKSPMEAPRNPLPILQLFFKRHKDC